MPLRLHELSVGVRIGLTGLLLTILLGLAASAAHLYWHSENRDERPGMTLDDIRAAYRGIQAPAPLAQALERGHPETLAPDSRKILQTWLAGDKISENYDNLDLGAATPAEVMSKSCLSCHSRNASAADVKARLLPLDTWEDVKKLAFARRVDPNPTKVVVASAHAHALSLGALSIVLALLAAASSLPRALVGGLVALTGAALFADIASWGLARQTDAFVAVIAVAGFAYNAGTTLLVLLLILDLWRPRAAKKPA